jgi:hypothetical protein
MRRWGWPSAEAGGRRQAAAGTAGVLISGSMGDEMPAVIALSRLAAFRRPFAQHRVAAVIEGRAAQYADVGGTWLELARHARNAARGGHRADGGISNDSKGGDRSSKGTRPIFVTRGKHAEVAALADTPSSTRAVMIRV